MFPSHEFSDDGAPSNGAMDVSDGASSDVESGAFLSETLSDALDHHERRLVLRYLHSQEFMVERRDVAEYLAAWEHGIEPQAVSEDQRDRVELTLHHTHFPKLEAADLVEFDDASEMAALTPKAESLIPLL